MGVWGLHRDRGGSLMAVLNSREAAQARGRKHASHVWECPLCDQVCRGNGGRSSHMRKHVKAKGYTDGDIFGWGLRVLFSSLWSKPDNCRVCKGNRNACMAHVPAEAPHGTE